MEKYINSQHRYYALDYYLKERFGKKVFKVALNGGFSCPNRDGKISDMGCIFCSEEGSGEFAGNKTEPLTIQFDKVKSIIHQKWPNALYIVYFQAFTNTYAPLSKIKELFEEAIKLDKNIVAISIATRPDCLPKSTLDYLEDLNKRIPVWIELGLQTMHDKTAKLINRGYDLSVFDNAVNNLKKRSIETIVHIINGLPGETKEMMMETVKYLNIKKINGVKIHSLYVLKNTELGRLYENEPFHILTLEEYVDIVCSQLAILDKLIVIHRVNGDAVIKDLIEPKWSIKKLVVMNEIDKKMREDNSYQGCLYN